MRYALSSDETVALIQAPGIAGIAGNYDSVITPRHRGPRRNSQDPR